MWENYKKLYKLLLSNEIVKESLSWIYIDSIRYIELRHLFLYIPWLCMDNLWNLYGHSIFNKPFARIDFRLPFHLQDDSVYWEIYNYLIKDYEKN